MEGNELKSKYLSLVASMFIVISTLFEFYISHRLETERTLKSNLIEAAREQSKSHTNITLLFLELDRITPAFKIKTILDKYYRNYLSDIPLSFWSRTAINFSGIESANILLASSLQVFMSNHEIENLLKDTKDIKFVTDSKNKFSKLIEHLQQEINENRVLENNKLDSSKQYNFDENVKHIKRHLEVANTTFTTINQSIQKFEILYKTSKAETEKYVSNNKLLSKLKQFILAITAILSLSSIFLSYKHTKNDLIKKEIKMIKKINKLTDLVNVQTYPKSIHVLGDTRCQLENNCEVEVLDEPELDVQISIDDSKTSKWVAVKVLSDGEFKNETGFVLKDNLI